MEVDSGHVFLEAIQVSCILLTGFMFWRSTPNICFGGLDRSAVLEVVHGVRSAFNGSSLLSLAFSFPVHSPRLLLWQWSVLFTLVAVQMCAGMTGC